MATTWQEDLNRAKAQAGPIAGYREVNTPATPQPAAPAGPGWQGGIQAARAAAGPTPAYQPVNTPPTPASVTPGVSPRTPDAPIAAYAATMGAPQPAPAPVAASPAPIGPITDMGSNIRGDVAAEYQRGAAAPGGGVATGVGMAAREAIVSPVSRSIGMISRMSQAARDGAGAVLAPVGSAIRAFVTGQPPTPAAEVARPGSTGQPGTGMIPASSQPAAQIPRVVAPQVGALDAAPPTPAPVAAVAPAPAGLPTAPEAPGQITQIAGRAGARAPAGSALGGFMRAMTGLGLMRRANNDQQREYKNLVSQYKNALEGAKVQGDLTRSAAETKRIEAETAKTGEEQKKLETDRKNAEQAAALREQIVNEKDPAKRVALERKLTAITGKTAPKAQVVMQRSVDPTTGMPVETPLIIDEAGNARPVSVQGQQSAPPGLVYAGRTPDGKKVYKDAQGKSVVEG